MIKSGVEIEVGNLTEVDNPTEVGNPTEVKNTQIIEKSDEDDYVSKKELFGSVLEKEGKFDMSSFDNMPYLFMGISTATFGNTSITSNETRTRENPFFKIKAIATNPNNTWEDRTLAVRYMDKIPHIHRSENTIEAMISILKDSQYPFEQRYHFFSNNERIIKLYYDLVNAGHKYVYENFELLNAPIEYKILSAQYILTQFPIGTYDIEGVQKYLQNVAENKEEQINYRAECADILSRAGYPPFIEIGDKVIEELGNLYTENKKSTIYTNLQNVHDKTVTENIIKTLRYLIQEQKVDYDNPSSSNYIDSGIIYERLLVLLENESKERTDRVLDSFKRILIDTARYEGLNMVDIMLLVWLKIKKSGNKEELESRFIDELDEMNKTCSTGQLSRLLNVFSGYYDNFNPVKISYESQLRANIFAHYTTVLNTLQDNVKEEIVNEMTQEDKPLIEEILFSYNPKDDLVKEFVPMYMDENKFNEIYEKAEKNFFGF